MGNRINATYGYRIEKNGKITYYPEWCGEGECYKDLKAWESGKGVIYIPEGDFDEHPDGLVPDATAWTRESWIDYVRERMKEDVDSNIWGNEDFVENVAECVLKEVEWEDLSTRVEDIDFEEAFNDFIR